MSADSSQPDKGWTIATYAVHNEAIRLAQEKFENERDRRYTEVATEREKALKIKETADLAALGLAREIQTYKDEKANELREQINSERGNYLTRSEYNAQHQALEDKLDAALKPLNDFMVASRGRDAGVGISATVAASLVGTLLVIIGLIITVYLATH